jgi:hypothetical protein
MDGTQLRVREVRPFGSIAKYSGLDLGRDQGTGRGDVTASFFRVTEDKRYESFTFVPDTLHNRLQLLQRQVELAEWDGAEWVLVGKESIDSFLAPAKTVALPRAVIEGVELTATPGNAEVAGAGAAVVVSGLSDFLQLKKEVQLELLAKEDFPADALKEILESADPRLSKKVREAAIAKAEKLVTAKA